VEQWQGIDNAFVAWMTARAGVEQPVQASDAARMVESVAERLQPRVFRLHRRPLVWATTAAAIIAVSSSIVLVTRETEVAKPLEEKGSFVTVNAKVLQPDKQRSFALEKPVGKVLKSPDHGRVVAHVGTDRIGLGSKSRVRVIALSEKRTSLKLERGTVACSVSPRTASRVFTVEAGWFTVEVKGTRFSVSRASGQELSVCVGEGLVAVYQPGQPTTHISAGQRYTFYREGRVETGLISPHDQQNLSSLLDDSELAVDDSPNIDTIPVEDNRDYERQENDKKQSRRKEQSPKPKVLEKRQLDTWQKWVLSGRLEEAEKKLSTYLRRTPDDEAAWSLLATCQRKSGKFKQAAESYSRVSELAEVSRANRARFMAASLLQDEVGNHAAAAALLEQYLRSSQQRTPTRAEATIRLARSLIVLKKKKRAKELLETIADTYGRNPVANRARKLLKKLADAEARESK